MISMKQPTLHTLFFLLLAFCGTPSSFAQTGTTVSMQVDKKTILIGEPITISLTAEIPENAAIRFFRIDTIPHFEVLQRGRIDTSNTGVGTVLKQDIQITGYDSGTWVIPPMILEEGVSTDSALIQVNYTPFNPEQPYHDIKDILDASLEDEKKKNWWWYAAGAVIVLIIIFYLVFRNKSKTSEPAPEVVRDYYQEAIDQLRKHQSSGSENKAWFTELVQIFRTYAHLRKGMYSEQQTSEDLLRQLKTMAMPENIYSELTQALRLSDFVKFAKYDPTATDKNASWDAVYKAIQELEKQS